MKCALPTHILGCLLVSSCLVPAAEFSPEGSHLFILSGQSNMREPLPSTFQNVVGQVFGKDRVVVVTHAQPSQSIRRWYKKWSPPKGHVENVPPGKQPTPHGDLYDQLMARVDKAVQGKPLATVTYIWMQGEADAESGWGEVYQESFYGVLDQIKADLKTDNVNYVLGRINDYWLPSKGVVDGELVRGIQQKIGDAHPHGDWVDTDDLNRGLNPWNVYQLCDGHFPPKAYKVLGERFARKASLLIDPGLKLDPEIFSAGFFDTSEQIASHGAIGATVRGSKPTGGSLAALSDGKFASAGFSDARWLTFEPGDGGVTELMLDLGKSTLIDQLGINLLFHPGAATFFPRGMTFATSEDGRTYSQVGRDIRFTYGRSKVPADVESQSLLVLAPAPMDKGKPLPARYVRIHIEAPKVIIDEIIINPLAVRQTQAEPES
jgi:hypothetical protein